MKNAFKSNPDIVQFLTQKKPEVEQRDKDNLETCAKWATTAEGNKSFRLSFKGLETGWNHPVCRVIDHLTFINSLWFNPLCNLASEGTFQTLIVNGILQGTFDSVSYNGF